MKDKTTAGLLALFLGGFGVHKFYLGQGVAGAFYLLFCWTFIPAIIAFFEALGLLFMSEHEFNRRYNEQALASSAPNAVQQAQNIVVNVPGSESGTDVVEQLKKLSDLRNAGILTEEEFTTQKAKLLR